MAMPLDESCLLQTVDHRGGCAAAEAGMLGQLGRTSRPVQNHHVQTFHVRDVDAQDLADRLVKKDRSNTEFSAAANDLCDQVALARAVSRLCHMTLKYSILIVKVNTKT